MKKRDMGKDSEKGQYRTPEGSRTWEYLSTFCCTLLSLCIGNAVGWNSPILGKLMAPDSPIALTSSDASTMTAVVALGQTLAPPLTVVITDKLGRKTSLIMAGIPLIISWGLIAVAKHVLVLFAARFIAGLSLGLGMCLVPMYLGEISSPSFRGSTGIFSRTMFNLGVLFMMIVTPYIAIRTSAYLCITLTLSFLISFWFMPESPYFLAMIGKTDEAEAMLEKLRGKTCVSDELELIEITLLRRKQYPSESPEETRGEKSLEKSSAFRQLCTVPGNRKALWIMVLFACSHHFGGFITVMVYGHIVFDAIDVDVETHICTIIVAVLQLITSVVTTFLVDRLGRKPLICVSGLTSGICLVIIGTYFYFMEYTSMDVRQHATIPFYAVFVLVVAANCGLVPLQNVMLSEIFETDIKALASCIFSILSGLIGAFAMKFYLLIAMTWGLGQCVPFLSFAVITWTCTGGLMWLLPETKGLTLLQIQKNLNA